MAIASVALAIYWKDLVAVLNEAIRSELMSHIIAIPFILTYLIYRKRKMLKAVIPFETSAPTRKAIPTHEILGATVCLLAFLLYWHGSDTFHPLEYHIVSLPLFVAGLILIIFNAQTLRVLAVPITFLLLLVPPPFEIVYALGADLSIISSEAAFTFLKATGLHVSLAEQYGTPVIILQKPDSASLTFAIDIACAGIYSLIGFAIFAIFITYIAKGKLWKKAIIFLIGFPLFYILNILRIIVIVLLGYRYGMELAMQAFHLLGGWFLIFIGTLMLLTISKKPFKIQIFTIKPKVMSCNYCNQNSNTKEHFCLACGRFLNPMNIKISKRDLSKIFILIISVILIINLQVPVFALTEGPAEVNIQTLGGEQTIIQILPEIPDYTTKFIYRDKRFEEIAKQDAALTYAYLPTNTSKTTIWVAIEIAETRSSLHRWEVCLITWPLTHGRQPQIKQLDLRDIQLLQNPPLTARYMAFQYIKSNLTQVVLYWYENALFNTGSSTEQKHVKISLIAYASNADDVPKIEESLLPFGKAVANYWQPIKTWSKIALTIAQHGATLVMITMALLVITLVVQAIKKRGEKQSNLNVYNRLALEKEKIILRAAHQAAKQNKPASNIIALNYQKLAGKSIELNMLLQKLNEAERIGLIRRDIISQEDEPILIWKSHIPFPKGKIL